MYKDDFQFVCVNSPIMYDLHFNDRVVMVRGNSASGKTYLFNQIKLIKNLPELSPLYKTLEDVIILNTDNIASIESYLTKPPKDKLFIVDEADLIALENPKLLELINQLQYCNFLLMGRDVELFGINPYCTATMQCVNNVVTLDYDPLSE